MRQTLIATALAATFAVTACGGDDDTTTSQTTSVTSEASTGTEATDATVADDAMSTAEGSESRDAANCADGNTVSDGMFTLATGDPAFPPYVIDDDPASGEGFEAAVGNALARELGFGDDSITWVRTAFDAAIAPGPKDFDVNLQQYTITDERRAVVDFSDGYYTAAQAIFGLADSPAADATTLADLQGLKIGVASGTTSVDYVENVIAPSDAPLIFNDNASAKQALESNQRDRQRPADRAVHHGGRDRGHDRLRPDRGQRHRSVRDAPRQGQPLDRVCQPGARRADRIG